MSQLNQTFVKLWPEMSGTECNNSKPLWIFSRLYLFMQLYTYAITRFISWEVYLNGLSNLLPWRWHDRRCLMRRRSWRAGLRGRGARVHRGSVEFESRTFASFVTSWEGVTCPYYSGVFKTLNLNFLNISMRLNLQMNNHLNTTGTIISTLKADCLPDTDRHGQFKSFREKCFKKKNSH